MVMVIEAMRQLGDPSKKISGYRLENLVFPRALLLSENEEGVETQLIRRRHKTSADSLAESGKFTVYSVFNNEWSSVCEGAMILPRIRATETSRVKKFDRFLT